MTRRTLRLLLLASLAAASCAQDYVADWQGILKNGGKESRHILRISKTADGAWSAKLFNIDQTHDWGLGVPVSSLNISGSTLKFSIERMRVTYEGRLSADHATIAGAWSQGQPELLAFRRATGETAWRDPSRHRIQPVQVSDNLSLEVLDWGGSGLPLLMLAGQGNTAHIFDQFAPKLTASCHVYGITRRGFGASTASVAECRGNCLARDVLAVIDALHLSRPVLAGHSIAGRELTLVGSRHPEKISGLIYLDAGFDYAMPTYIMVGTEPKYETIAVPILAIFAAPHIPPPAIGNDPVAVAAFEARDEAAAGAQAERFGRAFPSARVVRLRRADHYIFQSNEADVLQEMKALIGTVARAVR